MGAGAEGSLNRPSGIAVATTWAAKASTGFPREPNCTAVDKFAPAERGFCVRHICSVAVGGSSHHVYQSSPVPRYSWAIGRVKVTAIIKSVFVALFTVRMAVARHTSAPELNSS